MSLPGNQMPNQGGNQFSPQFNEQMAEQSIFGDEIDLRHYWRIINNNKWNILSLAAVVSIIVALVVMAMRPVYQSTITLMIESEQAKVVSIEEVYGLGSGNKEYYLTQFEILKSRGLAERVVKELDIRHHADFNPDLKKPRFGFNWRDYWPVETEQIEATEEQKLVGVVDGFMGSLSVAPVRNTQLVKVSFEAYDPKLAAAVVNKMAGVFVDSHLEAGLEASQKAVSWLSGRLEGLKSKLEEAEQNLQAYRDSAELVDVSGVKTLAARELDEITSNLVTARRARTETESIYTQVQSVNRSSVEALASLPAVLNHSSVRDIKNEQAKAQQTVAELSQRYGPLHPKMIAAQSKLETSTRNLATQTIRVVSSVEKDYRVAQASERALERQLANAKSRVQTINRKEFKLRELERDVQTNRQLYDMFFTRIKETDEAGGMESAHARVVDPGIVPRGAIKPRKTLSVILAFMASIVVGVLLVFLLDALDNTLKSPADVEERLKVPMLGAIPLVEGMKNMTSPLTVFMDENKGNFAESIRTIRTGLILSGLDKPHQITVVTSSVPSEGKSTTSISLAASLGQMEKTLLIDADMRRPALAKVCKFAPNTPGLSNFVAGTSELEDCIHRFEEAGVDVMTAGLIPSNPLELISAQRFVKALEALKEQYDRIVIDSAPMHAVSDALVLASYADALVYVVKSDATPYTVARNSIQRLLNSNAPVTGVVLNQFDARKAPKYGGDYYYYGGYYDYYGYSSDSSDEGNDKDGADKTSNVKNLKDAGNNPNVA